DRRGVKEARSPVVRQVGERRDVFEREGRRRLGGARFGGGSGRPGRPGGGRGRGRGRGPYLVERGGHGRRREENRAPGNEALKPHIGLERPPRGGRRGRRRRWR